MLNTEHKSCKVGRSEILLLFLINDIRTLIMSIGNLKYGQSTFDRRTLLQLIGTSSLFSGGLAGCLSSDYEFTECIEETVWKERVNPEPPQFVISVTNNGNIPFTIIKVVLDDIEVWTGEFQVDGDNTKELKINDISTALERADRNFINNVHVRNAVESPSYSHNVEFSSVENGYSTAPVYSDGRTEVYQAGPCLEAEPSG